MNKHYTFLKVLETWGQLLIKMAKQWRIFVIYALIITLISAIFGRWSYACKNLDLTPWCITPPQNMYVLIGYFVVFYGLLIYLLGSFIVDIYEGMFKNSVFKPKNVFSHLRPKIKMTSTLLKILVSLVVSVSLAISIIQKPANPVFEIEFYFFLITFALLLIPLFMIRCSACFAYHINTGSFAFRKVYDNTSGRSYISVMQLLLLIIFCLIINIRVIGYFSSMMQTYNYLSVALFTDFADCLLKLIYVMAIIMLFQAQYMQMEKEEQQKMEDKMAAEEGDDDELSEEVVSPKITAKAASKKKYKRKTQTNRKTSKKGKESD